MNSISPMKLIEPIFDVAYIILSFALSFYYISYSSQHPLSYMFGMIGFILVSGDCFHLIPRIRKIMFPVTNNQMDQLNTALGIGKCITSITMTFFYFFLILFHQFYFYKTTSMKLMLGVSALTILRIVFCLYPLNQWTTQKDILRYNIIRNIPFIGMGIISIVAFFQTRGVVNQPFSYMWIGISLSFIFYLLVVFFSHKHPMIGMLMIPKTILYLWILTMGISM